MNAYADQIPHAGPRPLPRFASMSASCAAHDPSFSVKQAIMLTALHCHDLCHLPRRISGRSFGHSPQRKKLREQPWLLKPITPLPPACGGPVAWIARALEGQARQGADRRSAIEGRTQQLWPYHHPPSGRRPCAPLPLDRFQAPQIRCRRQGRTAGIRSQPHRL